MLKSINFLLNNIFHINVNILRESALKEIDRYETYQKKYIDFKISKGDKVLDIGSGGYPFPLSTYIADLCTGNTSHRYESFKRDNKPVIICDIEVTPFKDKEFDYIYCSHVLEHVKHPDRACAEIMRIGKRGYIETPTKMTDILFNFTKLNNHHRWFIEILGEMIIFLEIDNRVKRDISDFFFKQFVSKWKNPVQETIQNNRDIFVNMFLWKDSFKYIIITKEGKIQTNL